MNKEIESVISAFMKSLIWSMIGFAILGFAVLCLWKQHVPTALILGIVSGGAFRIAKNYLNKAKTLRILHEILLSPYPHRRPGMRPGDRSK